MNSIFFGGILLYLNLSSAFAQQVQEDMGSVLNEQVQQVSVTGFRDPDWKSYRKMLEGLDAFESNHQLAPSAALQFLLLAKVKSTPIDGLKLKIVGLPNEIDVPISTSHTFVLPRDQSAADNNADLQLNRKKGLFRWRPDIHSPEVPSNARRLGDLRLECEVRWAIDQFDLSFIKIAYIVPLGGACHSSRSKVFYVATKPIIGATLVFGEHREKLDMDRLDSVDHTLYSPPLHDKSWPDNTLIEFEFAESNLTSNL
ncbi:hypothetical protein [Solimicrobium silvestre]|uniref:Uncharacterized protein n=1 Tax=Solimicrobium silvestre TaxID=2099400 RepID=A0A2S9H4V5_9BURK|nr:hypothetical protein [Solimicrobium silvestre]PRC95014.1 hypothetical protein S2091_0209 [Solimicrobium silvestre]